MSRVVETFECEVPIEDIPRALIVTTYDGHMLNIDVNRYTGHVYVQYPKETESLHLLSRIFQILDMLGFIDAIIIDPNSLIEKQIAVAGISKDEMDSILDSVNMDSILESEDDG